MPALSPFSDFQNLTPAQLSTVQAKLTFVGVHFKPIQSVAFTSDANTVDVSKFVPFQQPGVDYDSDFVPIKSFKTAVAELQSVIQEVGKVPAVVAGGVASEQYISFSLFNTIGGTDKAFEAVLNNTDGVPLFQALRVALAGNRDGVMTINEMGCFTALREPGQPVDVSSKVSVAIGGVRLNRTTGRFVGTATYKNTSADPVPTPVSLVLFLDSEGDTLRLFNADGFTCGTSPEGYDFINIPVAGNQLAPGAGGQVNLEFTNPDQTRIIVTTKVLAGPGAR